MVSYILILRLDEGKTIEVGKLGRIEFKEGYYLYVGSAKNSLKRIERHFKMDKKLHWHIDYLSLNSQVMNAIIFNKLQECEIADRLSKRFKKIKNFGCSDCKCLSHLFYSAKEPTKELNELFKDVKKLQMDVNGVNDSI